MHKLLQDFAELVGREWARRWLEHLETSKKSNASKRRTRSETLKGDSQTEQQENNQNEPEM